jgi:hypothetical protein
MMLTTGLGPKFQLRRHPLMEDDDGGVVADAVDLGSGLFA